VIYFTACGSKEGYPNAGVKACSTKKLQISFEFQRQRPRLKQKAGPSRCLAKGWPEARDDNFVGQLSVLLIADG
jgi:hypothetical protein